MTKKKKPGKAGPVLEFKVDPAKVVDTRDASASGINSMLEKWGFAPIRENDSREFAREKIIVYMEWSDTIIQLLNMADEDAVNKVPEPIRLALFVLRAHLQAIKEPPQMPPFPGRKG